MRFLVFSLAPLTYYHQLPIHLHDTCQWLCFEAPRGEGTEGHKITHFAVARQRSGGLNPNH